VTVAVEHCVGCGAPLDQGDHGRCRERLRATDPPRYCAGCGRRLVVQVLPVGWTARCVRCGPVDRATGRPTGDA